MATPEARGGSTAPVQYFDLYRLAVEMADRSSARRGSANNFFLTLNTGLASLIGLSGIAIDADDRAVPPFMYASVCVVGVALSCTWWVMVRSYRDLNRAKFRVILDLEMHLPVAVFGDEWKLLKDSQRQLWTSRYAELSTVERVVPVVFLLVYLANLVRAVVA